MTDPLQDAIRDFPQKTPCVWYPKTKNPPKGFVWATDGNIVWPIYTDGTIPDGAALVRAWTDGCVPEVPTELPT